MDEQMIEKMRDAIWNTLCPGIRRTAEDDARYEEAARAAHSVAGKVAELEGLLWRAMDDASMEPGDWYAEARALLDKTLPTAEDIRGILRDDAALAPYPERR